MKVKTHPKNQNFVVEHISNIINWKKIMIMYQLRLPTWYT